MKVNMIDLAPFLPPYLHNRSWMYNLLSRKCIFELNPYIHENIIMQQPSPALKLTEISFQYRTRISEIIDYFYKYWFSQYLLGKQNQVEEPLATTLSKLSTEVRLKTALDIWSVQQNYWGKEFV